MKIIFLELNPSKDLSLVRTEMKRPDISTTRWDTNALIMKCGKSPFTTLTTLTTLTTASRQNHVGVWQALVPASSAWMFTAEQMLLLLRTTIASMTSPQQLEVDKVLLWVKDEQLCDSNLLQRQSIRCHISLWRSKTLIIAIDALMLGHVQTIFTSGHRCFFRSWYKRAVFWWVWDRTDVCRQHGRCQWRHWWCWPRWVLWHSGRQVEGQKC